MNLINTVKIVVAFLAVFVSFGCDDSSSGKDVSDSGTNDADVLTDKIDVDAEVPDCTEHFFETVMIPMDDGEELSAIIRRPLDENCVLPTILIQTPYGKDNAKYTWFEGTPGLLFASTDYNFVILDWRGFFGSSDAEPNNSRPHPGYDGADTIRWISNQPWSDSNVGTWGVSALCVVQYQTAQEASSSLKAMVPIFCNMNANYEQSYPGGVLRREYIDFIQAYFGGDPALYEAHPYKDLAWDYLGSLYKYTLIKTPALVVAGWYDLYNPGAYNDFENLVLHSAQEVQDKHRLLAGPWIHHATGGEMAMGRLLTEQEKLYLDTEFIIQANSLAFFDLHLRNSGEPQIKKVKFIPDGELSFFYSDEWPPENVENKIFYINSEGLGESPSTDGNSLSWQSDPDSPVPTVGGHTLVAQYTHGPDWQDELLERSDVIYFESELLGKMTVAGRVKVFLEVSTDAPDTDFVVKLTKIGEDGRHLLITDGVRRLKLRETFATPVEVTSGEHYIIEIEMTNNSSLTLEEGDRLGLILSSSSFSRFDINPQNGNDFYYDGDTTYVSSNYVFFNENTRIEIPVLQ
ncbi:MAG: CocE/NonD family hydrolase [Deltaproteobacteria bacterium]|nr:CocE/NonD family hydrolase [Deltaproteobacteria bacterium]